MKRETIHRPLTLAVLLGLLLLCCGCPPSTPIRRSAFVPRNTTPSRLGGPLKQGDLHAFGQINTVGVGDALGEEDGISDIEDPENLLENVPQEGDPGLFIPTLMIGGGIYYGLADVIEIGAQLHATRLDWAKANFPGVLPFPEDRVDLLWMAGLGVRGNLPIEKTNLSLSGMFELNYSQIPQATYVCQVCIDNPNTFEPEYIFDRIDREGMFLPSINLQATYAIKDIFFVYLHGGAQRNVKNIGFDPDIENLDETTLEGYWYGQAGLGAEVRYKPIFLNIAGSFPFALPERGIPLGFSLTVQIGLAYSINPAEKVEPAAPSPTAKL